MSNDFISVAQRPSARKKYTYKTARKSAMMSGELPSPPADDARNAWSTRKVATANYDATGNGTPPSAQRPPASQDSAASAIPDMAGVTAVDHESDSISLDDVDDDTLLAQTQPAEMSAAAKSQRQPRNAFTVLTSSQAAVKTTPAARPPTIKWTADEEWTVVEGIRDGLSQAQIRELLPVPRSGSAIRGKKKELNEKYGKKLKTMVRPTARTPAPPVPLRKSWSTRESGLLRTCMLQGLSDRDIQALHFPDRTEDSVIGKLRKLRATFVKPHTDAANASLLISRLQAASSSPAIPGTSSQTAQRSSPAQAALKRKAEVVTDRLPAVQEEAAHTAASNEADNSISESVASNSPAIAESVASGSHDAESIAASSPTSAAKAGTAYVVLPEYTDMTDVVDFRARSPVQHGLDAQDLEARYAAITPPFLPGQESDQEGVLRTSKLSLWREAYSRCGGNVDAAYRKYDSLRTDEHMLQAVCNLDYEIINGIKAVRMRRLREDAIREGKPPPLIPVKDQPHHLDLFGEKQYGKYYTYTPWAKETEEMYLNEPIIFGPRPKAGVHTDYIDPMQQALQDDDGDEDGDDGEHDEMGYDQGMDVGHDGHVADAVDGKTTIAEPYHGHVSEIDDDEVVDSSKVVSSHGDAESALAINVSNKRDRKRKHSAIEETKTSTSSRKLKKLKVQEKRKGGPEPGRFVADEVDVPVQDLTSGELEPAVETMASAEIIAQDDAIAPDTGSLGNSDASDEAGELHSVEMRMSPEHSMKGDIDEPQKTAEREELTLPESNEQHKNRQKKIIRPRDSMPMAADTQPLSTKQKKNKKNKKNKKKLVGKGGVPVSMAAIRRQRRALRRSDASFISEVIAEPSDVVEKKVTAPAEGAMARPSPIAVRAATAERLHPEDNPSQWMRDIVKNAKHKPPPVRRNSPPPVDPNNLFGRGDPSEESANSDSSGDEDESDSGVRR